MSDLEKANELLKTGKAMSNTLIEEARKLLEAGGIELTPHEGLPSGLFSLHRRRRDFGKEAAEKCVTLYKGDFHFHSPGEGGDAMKLYDDPDRKLRIAREHIAANVSAAINIAFDELEKLCDFGHGGYGHQVLSKALADLRPEAK